VRGERDQIGLTYGAVATLVAVFAGTAVAAFAFLGGGTPFPNANADRHAVGKAAAGVVRGGSPAVAKAGDISRTSTTRAKHHTARSESRTPSGGPEAAPTPGGPEDVPTTVVSEDVPTSVSKPPVTAPPTTGGGHPPTTTGGGHPPTTAPVTVPSTTQPPPAQPFCSLALPATVAPGADVFGSLASNQPNAPFTLTMSGRILGVNKKFRVTNEVTDGHGSASIARVNLSGKLGSLVTLTATFASTSCSGSYQVIAPDG
jgi:hypothetical protein